MTARVAIEAGGPQGWDRWVGERGVVLAIDHFGASAPYKELYARFGLTAERVLREARRLLGARTKKPAGAVRKVSRVRAPAARKASTLGRKPAAGKGRSR